MHLFQQLTSKFQGARTKVLVVLCVLNLLVSASLSMGLYFLLNGALMSELDGRLHTAARAIPFVLPEKYIANALQGKGVEPSEHLKNLLNHQYAKKIGVEHLYVLNKRGKDVVYLAGSEAIVST